MKLSWVVSAIVLVCAVAGPTARSVSQTSIANQEKRAKGILVKNGLWGGNDVEMQVSERGATLEFDCASGSIPETLSLDAYGKFQANGTFQSQHGGPVHKRQSAPGIPVTYAVTIDGGTMKLEFVLPQNQRQGPFTLLRGQEGRLRKCH